MLREAGCAVVRGLGEPSVGVGVLVEAQRRVREGSEFVVLRHPALFDVVRVTLLQIHHVAVRTALLALDAPTGPVKPELKFVADGMVVVVVVDDLMIVVLILMVVIVDVRLKVVLVVVMVVIVVVCLEVVVVVHVFELSARSVGDVVAFGLGTGRHLETFSCDPVEHRQTVVAGILIHQSVCKKRASRIR